MVNCGNAFREHRFPLLFELCDTSHALEALVAAHSQDELSLYSLLVLCLRELLARIKQRPTQAAVPELFHQNELGGTALAFASSYKAPVEVLETMINLAKLDAEKRNILDITCSDLRLPMHIVANRHPDLAAIKLLVRHHHSALLAMSREGASPLDYAIQVPRRCGPPAQAHHCLRARTLLRRHPPLGTSPTLEAIAVRSTDDVPLLVLCQFNSWEASSARSQNSPTQVTINEMHSKDENGRTAFATAVVADARVEVLESELGKQDTKVRKIARVCDKDSAPPLGLALYSTDAATSSYWLARTLDRCTVPLNLPSSTTRRAPLSCPFCASASLQWSTATSPPSSTSVASPTSYWWRRRCPVHHAAEFAGDIAIIKPVIREHDAELLNKDKCGRTPLDYTKRNPNPAVPPFFTEAETAFCKCNYPALIKLCGPTPDWAIRAKLAKDKKDREDAAEADRLEAVFFD